VIPAVNGAGNNFATGVNDTGYQQCQKYPKLQKKINTKSFVKNNNWMEKSH
jgi:hypothetical protein